MEEDQHTEVPKLMQCHWAFIKWLEQRVMNGWLGVQQSERLYWMDPVDNKHVSKSRLSTTIHMFGFLMIVPKHYLLCQWQIEQRKHSRLSFHWDVNQCLQSVMITGIWDNLCLTFVISNVQAKAVETQRPTLIKLFDVHNPSRLFAPCIDEFLPKNVLSFHALFYALDNLKAQVQKICTQTRENKHHL